MTAGHDDTRTEIALQLPTYALEKGTNLGEYVIEGRLGEGAMGVVFAATHPTIGKRAAIKVLRAELCEDDQQIERFIDEARAVNKIGHPNIVDIFAFGEMPDGRRYFVMELLVGETLRDRLRRGALGVAEAGAVIRPLARALEAAHEAGIVHRDLKPENVFLVERRDEDPQVKLLDFGVAKLGHDPNRMYKTGAGEIVGTPMYIAPEQARDSNQTDARSDIYALGAIAFELLCGRPPFLAKNVMEVLTAHLTEQPVAPSTLVDVPPEVDATVLAMLAKDPARRPTLATVRKVFGSADQTPVPRSVRAGVAQSMPMAVSRRPARWPVVIGGLGAIAVAVAVFVLMSKRAGTAPPDAAAAIAMVSVDAAVEPDATAADIPVVDALAVREAPPVRGAMPDPVARPVRVPAPTHARLAITVRGAAAATVDIDGQRSSVDGSVTIGHHDVVVTARGQTRRLSVDVTSKGASVVVTFTAPPPPPHLPPPQDDRDLLRPGSLRK